jgi:putative peptide zinc metalloprotease protein
MSATALSAGELAGDWISATTVQLHAHARRDEQLDAHEWWAELARGTERRFRRDLARADDCESVDSAVNAAYDRSLERPRAVDGVKTFTVEHPGEPLHYILQHPAGHLLRYSPAAWFLFQRMDGTRTVRDLAFDYFQEFGAVAPERIVEVVDQARDRGFLEPLGPDAYTIVDREVSPPTRRFAQKWRNFFERRWAIPKFDEWIEGFVHNGGFMLFTLPVALVAIPLIGYGFGVWLRELGSTQFQLLQTGGSLIAGFFTYALIKIGIGIVHELGQASYLKSLGYRVPEGGVLWYYGVPYVYHNSNYIWLEPKPRRIFFSLLGPMIELTIGALAFIAFDVMQWLNIDNLAVMSIIYKVGMFATIGAFFKMNPLLELNGYFVLVDLTNTPRLMARSFYFLYYDIWGKLFKREPFTATEKVYVLYVSLSVLWGVGFYYLIAIIGQQHVIPAWEEITGVGAVGISLYIIVALVLIAPGAMSAATYLMVFWQSFTSQVRLIVQYTSQKLLWLGVIGTALVVPYGILILLLPADDTPLVTDLYYIVRLPAMIGCFAGWLAVRFTLRRWIDHRTRPFIRDLGLAAAVLGTAQIAYLVGVIDNSNQVLLDIAGAGEMVAALVLVPSATMSLASLVHHVSPPGPIRLMLKSRELIAFVLGMTLFFSLGKLAYWAGTTQSDPNYIIRAAIRSTTVLALIWVLIPAWTFVGSLVPGVSIFAWFAVATALTVFFASVLLHAFQDAAHSQALFFAHQHTALGAAAGLALGGGMAMLLIVAIRVRFRLRSRDEIPAVGEIGILRRVFARLVAGLLHNVGEIYGKARREAVRRDLQFRLGVQIDLGEVRDAALSRLDLAQTADRLHAQFSRAMNVFIDEFGREMYERALVNLHDSLYWQEREVAHRHIFRGQYWGVTLQHQRAPAGLDDAHPLFRRIPLFADLRDDELSGVIARCREERYMADQVIVTRHDDADVLRIVLSGRVELRAAPDDEAPASGTDGDPVTEGIVLAELAPGDYFGEAVLLDTDVSEPFDVRAVEPTTVLALRREAIEAVTQQFQSVRRKLRDGLRFLETLEAMPIFAGMNPARVREAATCMTLQRVEPGEIIVRQGETGDSFFVVRSGTVRVVRHLGDVDEERLADLGPGTYFGEVALLEYVPRTATVLGGDQPAEVLRLDREDFDRLLGKYIALEGRTRRVRRARRQPGLASRLSWAIRHDPTADASSSADGFDVSALLGSDRPS